MKLVVTTPSRMDEYPDDIYTYFETKDGELRVSGANNEGDEIDLAVYAPGHWHHAIVLEPLNG